LEKNPEVKEYLGLRDIKLDNSKLIVMRDAKLIDKIYYHYLYKIKEEETNGIYVYLGTYRYSDYCDIVHSSSDERVDDDSPCANYRLYQDIEQYYGVEIPISKSKEFEDTHTIINPKTQWKQRVYYDIQREFFTTAVKTSQESAKKRILRKYPKLNRKV